MKQRCRLYLLLVALSLLAHSAFAATALVPMTGVHPEAEDLLTSTGVAIDSAQATQMSQSGVDVSLLEPSVNDLWNPSLTPAEPSFPNPGSALAYQSILASPTGIFRAVVADQSGQTYTLDISIHLHETLLRNALMQKLGYQNPAMLYLPQLTLQFKDAAQKKLFREMMEGQDTIQGGTGYESARWVIADPSDTPTLTLQDVALEISRVTVPQYYWGIVPPRPAGVPNPPAGTRAVRALLGLFALTEVPDSINIFGWEAAQIMNQHLIVSTDFADSFGETTISDLRWLARKMGQLTREQWSQLVVEAHYPDDVGVLVAEKLISRRNDFLGLLGLGFDLSKIPENRRISAGRVQNGKLVLPKDSHGRISGFAQTFAYGDPADPLSASAIWQLAGSEAINAAIGSIATRITSMTPSLTLQGALTKLSALRSNQFLHHCLTASTTVGDLVNCIGGSGKPYQFPVASWGGVVGGLNWTASRSVATGNFFGNLGRAQVVDQIGVQASIGYYEGLDGIRNLIPSATTGLSVGRTYTLVKPVNAMKETVQVSLKELLVPEFMDSLGKAISTSRLSSDPVTEAKGFFNRMGVGETMIVTDSVGDSLSVGATIPLTTLASAQIGLTHSGMILRQTYITRTQDGVQVYLTQMRQALEELSLDARFWVNVFGFSVARVNATAHTHAFIINQSQLSADDSLAQKTLIALRSLLISNGSESLEKSLSPFVLDQKFKATVEHSYFLWNKTVEFNETHLLAIRPPTSSANTLDPRKSNAHERDFVQQIHLHRNGNNYFGFLASLLTATTPQLTLTTGFGSDPTSAPFGTGHYTEILTEAETTTEDVFHPVTMIQENWSGWKISRASFLGMINELNTQFSELSHYQWHIIDTGPFEQMKDLLFYQLSTNVVMKPGSADLLMDQLGFKETDDKKLLDSLSKKFPFALDAQCARSFGTIYSCFQFPKYIGDLWDLRRQRIKNSRDQAIWDNRVIAAAESALSIADLVQAVGVSNVYLQVRVQGCRTGFETTLETDPCPDYLSNTWGAVDPKIGTGAVKDLVAHTGLSDYEVEGLYFSGSL